MKNFFVQKVNSPLCIVLVGLMAFWTVLYYFTHKAQAIADNLAIDEAAVYETHATINKKDL